MHQYCYLFFLFESKNCFFTSFNQISLQQKQQERIDKAVKVFEKEKASYEYNRQRDQLLKQQKQKSLQDQVAHEIQMDKQMQWRLDNDFRKSQKLQKQYNLEQTKRQNLSLSMQNRRKQSMESSYYRQQVISGGYKRFQQNQKEFTNQLYQQQMEKEDREKEYCDQMKLSQSLRLQQKGQELDQKLKYIKSRTQEYDRRFSEQTMRNINQQWDRSQYLRLSRTQDRAENYKERTEQLKQLNDDYDQKIADLKFKYDMFY